MGAFRRLAVSLVVPVAAVAAWEAVSRAGWVSPLVLPAPSQVLLRWLAYARPAEPDDPAGGWLAWALSGELPRDAATSLLRVGGGFALGAGLALPLGLLMGASKPAHALLNPLVQLVRPIPPIAFIPLAILWFGAAPARRGRGAGRSNVGPGLIAAARCLDTADRQLRRNERMSGAWPAPGPPDGPSPSARAAALAV